MMIFCTLFCNYKTQASDNKEIILMISLQDEIQKFQNLVYNQQLQQFVTVDQMFVGGGITMQSIIRQTNFIVEELKKMNSVFVNYCKLNGKVYDRIGKHEVTLHEENSRLNANVSLVDRKLEEAMKKILQIHEDTVAQNQKSHSILMDNLGPIRKELEQKVDQATFSAMAKKFLEDNQDEEGENRGEGDHGEDQGGNGNGSGGGGIGSDRAPNSPYPRKKGKVGYDQFYKFREELDAKLKTSDNQVLQLQKQSQDSKNLFNKYIPQIKNLAGELAESKTSIYKIEMAQQDNLSSLTKEIQKVGLELNNRLNEQVWKDKFETFNEKQIKPIVQKLQESLRMQQSRFEVSKEENMNKFRQIDADILKGKTQTTVLKRQIDKIKKQMSQMNTQMQANRRDFQNQIKEVNKDIQKLSQQTTNSLKNLEEKTAKELKELKKALDDLVHTIEQSVYKVVSKKFEFQLKLIDKSIKESSDMTKQVKIDVGIVEQEIKNMKNILAQKANFSDFVQHVQKKADKQDFKELQNKIHQSSQNMPTKQHQSINLSVRCDRSENGASSRKIPSINKISNCKTLLTGQIINKPDKLDLDSGTKLFMCGMEGHMTETRKSWTQTTGRRRNNKSSTPIVSDFML